MVPLILCDLEGSGGYSSIFCRLAGGGAPALGGAGDGGSGRVSPSSSSHCMQSDSSGSSIAGAWYNQDCLSTTLIVS